MEDEVLTEGFDRLARLSGASAPSMTELEGRVVIRARRRRNRQRAVLAGCAVVLVALGLAAALGRPSSDEGDQLGSKPAATTAPTGADAEPVFTIARLPEDLAFRSCVSDEPDPSTGLPASVTCTFDVPATGAADGLRITRVVAGGTPALRQAWDAGDAAAAVEASGGSDAPAAARFTTLGGTRVLDLAPGGAPSSDQSAAIRLLVGDDLVDIGSTNVPLTDLGRVATGLSMQPPAPYVQAALAALPEGSVAAVQGERPLWIQADPVNPGEQRTFGTGTEGAELAVPGSTGLISVDLTSGLDVDGLFDGLLAANDPALTESEAGGRRALVLGADGMLPTTVPEPRSGPQVLVRGDDGGLVRVKDPDGTTEQLEAVAAAVS